MPAGPGVERRLTDAMTNRSLAAGLRRRIQAAEAALAASTERADAAGSKVRTEHADVARLEDLTWSWILAKLSGHFDDTLEREKAELQAAEYTYRTEQSRADADRRALDGLKEQLAALGDVQAAYAAALADKEEWLAHDGAPSAPRLASIAEEIGRAVAEAKEIEEAFAAGHAAADVLANAARLLGSASSWAGWDTWGGGGMFTDMAKHRKMEEAQRCLVAADAALKVFGRELSDVARTTVGDLNLSGFVFAFDFWFDNFFTDYAVKKRIDNAYRQVEATQHRLLQLMRELNARGKTLAGLHADLKAERESLLTAH